MQVSDRRVMRKWTKKEQTRNEQVVSNEWASKKQQATNEERTRNKQRATNEDARSNEWETIKRSKWLRSN